MSVSYHEIVSMLHADDLGWYQATVEISWPTVRDKCPQNRLSDVMILFTFAMAIAQNSAVASERLDSYVLLFPSPEDLMCEDV